MKSLVRMVASSFADAITSQALAVPIAFSKAVQQHGDYVHLLRSILGTENVIEVPADVKHPDCCFIEDTAVVVGNTAIISRIGAASRQGEEDAAAGALQQLGYKLQHIREPGTLDGGDVLQLPGSRHILVGLSQRTNEAAVQQMQQILPQYNIHGIPVAHGLHLKSACTALDSSTLLFADNEAGRGLSVHLQRHPALASSSWQHALVEPDLANVLRVGPQHVVIRNGFPKGEQLLEQLAAQRGFQLHKVDFSEFAKADGSLTCCSILLP